MPIANDIIALSILLPLLLLLMIILVLIIMTSIVVADGVRGTCRVRTQREKHKLRERENTS